MVSSDRPELVSATQPAAPGTLAVLVGLLGAPAAWSVQTLASYTVAAYECGRRQVSGVSIDGAWLVRLEWIIAACCIVLGLASTLVAVRNVYRLRGRHGDASASGERRHFLIVSGAMVSAGFAIALLFTGMAALTALPCHAVH